MKHQDADKAFLRILRKQQGDSPAACPDANDLAAYLEMKLSDDETARFEEHAADCAPCREALALAMKLAGEEKESHAITAVPQRPAYRTSPLRFAFGGVLVLVAGVLLFQATRQVRVEQKRTEIAGGLPQSNISGGQAAVMRSADVRPEAPATPSKAPAETAVLGGNARLSANMSKSEAVPSAPPPSVSAQLAAESGKPTLTVTAVSTEEARKKTLSDLILEAQQRRSAQANLPEAKMAVADRPAEARGKTGQALDAVNQAAASQTAQALNQLMAQNAPVAQLSNVANQAAQPAQASNIANQVAQPVRNDAQAAAGATTQSQRQAGGGLSARGGARTQLAMPPMRLAESQKVEARRVAPDDVITVTRGDPIAGPSFYKELPALKASRPVLALEERGLTRRLGNKIFYQMAGVWMDAEYASHPAASAREVARDSSEFRDILKAEPRLSPLRSWQGQVLMYWKGTNYTIR